MEYGPLALKDLGNCCGCEKRHPTVRNLVTLDKRIEGERGGWGCVVCDLPPEGAVAVLCDDCIYELKQNRAEIKFACLGYPGENRRIQTAKLTEVYEHDNSKHPESWDWEKALFHFREIRAVYQDLLNVTGANTSLALEVVFRPLAQRYHSGERTFDLYQAMKAVE